MNCSADVFTLLCNAVHLAKDEQIRSVRVLRSQLLAHHPGQASLIDAAIELWANYACRGATTSAQGGHHDANDLLILLANDGGFIGDEPVQSKER